jgi:signal transduction histidine kinase
MLTGGWWQHRSLRAKVTHGAGLVITAGVVVLAAGVLLGIRYLEISVLDSAAVERANSVTRLARKGELSNPIPSVGESHVQVLDARGHPLASTTDLDRNVAVVPIPLPDALRTGRPVTRGGLPDADGATHRVVARQAVFGGQPVTIVVAVSLVHELRSPLTATMAETETLVLAADPDAWEQRGPVLLDGLRRLHGLMDDLLALAGLDDPGHRSARRTVDLDDVVFAEMSEVRAATDRTIDVSGVSAAQVLADPRAMARVVRNLLDNAVRHARSEVAVTLHEDDRAVVLAVADDGTGVPADQRERIFDRFVRLDAARGQDSGGSGLGLATVRDLVDAHDGHVWISDAPSGADAARYPGAWVHVRLPAELR